MFRNGACFPLLIKHDPVDAIVSDDARGPPPKTIVMHKSRFAMDWQTGCCVGNSIDEKSARILGVFVANGEQLRCESAWESKLIYDIRLSWLCEILTRVHTLMPCLCIISATLLWHLLSKAFDSNLQPVLRTDMASWIDDLG